MVRPQIPIRAVTEGSKMSQTRISLGFPGPPEGLRWANSHRALFPATAVEKTTAVGFMIRLTPPAARAAASHPVRRSSMKRSTPWIISSWQNSVTMSGLAVSAMCMMPGTETMRKGSHRASLGFRHRRAVS